MNKNNKNSLFMLLTSIIIISLLLTACNRFSFENSTNQVNNKKTNNILFNNSITIKNVTRPLLKNTSNNSFKINNSNQNRTINNLSDKNNIKKNKIFNNTNKNKSKKLTIYSTNINSFMVDCSKTNGIKCFAASYTVKGYALGLINKKVFTQLINELNLNNQNITSLYYKNNTINGNIITVSQRKILEKYKPIIDSQILQFSDGLRKTISSSVIDTTTNISSGLQYLKLIKYNNSLAWNFSYGLNNNDLTTIIISFNGKKILQ